MSMRRTGQAIVLAAAGLYVTIGHFAGYATANALLLLLLGVEKYRSDRSRLGIILIAVACLLVIIHQIVLFAVLIAVSLGFYFYRTRSLGRSIRGGNHRLLFRLRHDESSWVMRSMNAWHALGEVRLDLTLAVAEEPETTIVLQGLVGDIRLIVPDDCGLDVEAFVLIGHISFGQTKEGGVFHRFEWKSPDYERCEHRLKLQCTYVVGDIRITTA